MLQITICDNQPREVEIYIMTLFKSDHFLQCYTPYLTNMRQVEGFAKDSFTLRGGKIVPIAAKPYPVVRDQYMNYLMAKGECK